MNLFAWSGLILGLTILPLGIFVFWKNKDSKVNRTLALFCLAGAIWGFGGYKIATILKGEVELAFFWWRTTHIGVILMPVFLWHFVYSFLGIKRKKIIVAVYLTGIFFLIVNFFTDLFISNMRWVFNSFYWDSPPGLFYYPFVLFFFGAVIYAHYELYKAYKKSVGIKHAQIKYLFLAALAGFSGGGTCFLPVFRIDFYPILNFTTPLYPAIMAYAIIRYRLMDIRLVLGRGAVYVFSFATVIALAFLMMFLNNQLAEPLPLNISGPLIIVISLLLFQPIFRFFEKLASRYFYYTFYSYQQVLTDLGRKLTRVLELKELSSLIVNTLMETMKLDRTVILLREPETGDYQIQKNIGFKEENGISLVKDNFLTQYLEKTQTPLVSEELSLIIRDTAESEERKRLEKLRDNMKRIEAALCLPLLIEEKIIGMVVLGNKISKESYSVQDLQLLTALATQSSVAFQNARLYSEVEDLSKNLEKRVREQTKELQKAYEELKVLDKAKSEFISMASHQLRTPLSAIKGYISMMVDGSYGQVPEKAREKLKNVFQSNERLIRIVNDLLNISKIELGKMELEKAPTQLEELIQSCCEEMKIEAEKKNLKFIFKKPKTPLPKLAIDSLKIRQVILNLIDNAIRYTKKGEIEIKTERVASKALITVRDTGEGLSGREQRDIFEGFTRGSAGIAYFIEGAGLGLYVAKKFLELHQGKIWAESQGKGRGSTFYVELPLE